MHILKKIKTHSHTHTHTLIHTIIHTHMYKYNIFCEKNTISQLMHLFQYGRKHNSTKRSLIYIKKMYML